MGEKVAGERTQQTVKRRAANSERRMGTANLSTKKKKAQQ